MSKLSRFINMKGSSGAVKGAMIILTLGFILASVSYIIPVLASHISYVTVVPNIVEGGTNVNFVVTVENDASSATSIHEFRIYEHNEFSNLVCDSETNWNGPYYATNQFGDFCFWTAQEGYEITPDSSRDFSFSADTPSGECCRPWQMETRDLEEHWQFAYPGICIDTTPPETTKSFVGPHKIENGVEWIDGVTKVVLSATDSIGLHDAGIKKIKWRNTIVEDKYCWDQQLCQGAQGSGDFTYDYNPGPEKDYTIEIQKEGESCHLLEFYAKDNVNNEEEVNKNCFFVDTTPPELIKTVGEPKVECIGIDCDYWVRDEHYDDLLGWVEGTPITMDCDDSWDGVAPHPSGDEEVCYQVSFDYPEWHYITTDYCLPEDMETITQVGHEGDWCCVDAPEEIVFVEDSLHDLEFFCRDAVDKKSEIDLEYFRVDSLPPIIEKTMIGEDHIGYRNGELNEDACPPRDWYDDPYAYEDECYVRDDGLNGVAISVWDDPTYDCAVDAVECYKYMIWYAPSPEACGEAGGIILLETSDIESFPTIENSIKPLNGVPCLLMDDYFTESQEIIFMEDSYHELFIVCWDALYNYNYDYEVFYVDSTPPETIKWYGEPYKIEPNPYCVEMCEDLCIDIINGCDLEECIEDCPMIEWISTDTPIYLDWDDEKVGTENVWYKNIVFEEIDMDSLGVSGHELGVKNGPEGWEYCWEICDQWIPNEPGNQDWILYWTDGDPEPDPIYKPEESCHIFEYYSEDKLGNVEEVKWQCFFVDDTPPASYKTIDEPFVGWAHGMLEPTDGYENSDNWELRTTAYGTDNYDFGSTVYGTTNHGEHRGYEHSYLMSPEISLPSSGTITLTFDSYTANEGGCPEWYDVEWIEISDDGSSWTTLNTCEDDGGDDYLHWDSDKQWRTFSYDISAFAGENVYIRFRYNTGDDCCGDYDQEGWYIDNVEIIEDSNTVFFEDFENILTYVTMETPIWLDCYDQWPHPVDQETLYWRFSLWEDGFEGEPEYSDWYSAPYWELPIEIYFLEDSWHDLEYYCVDYLGNNETDLMNGEPHRQYYIVDTEPPIIEKEIVGPWYGDCPPEDEGDDCYIDGVTEIHVDVYDPEPHPVNDVWCYWEYYWNGEWWEGDEFGEEGEIIIFEEDSEHELHIYCEDALGNWIEDYEVFLVDLEPPWTWKWYEPKPYEGEGAEWITSDYLVYLDWDDEKSGVAVTYWRNTVVNDEYCWDEELCYFEAEGSGEWNEYDGPFNKPEDSCHLIEYYSVDRVGKIEEVNKQCVFVDNQPPEPNKTVGIPNSTWDGQDANFYDIADKCWSADPAKYIECWKVTLFTPITLDCIDPDPHPVEHEETCFMVSVDGDDATEAYCDYVGGVYDKYGDGYCCGLNAPFKFYFNETTEHNLDYYCIDALGNKGDPDEEKFKVEETAFEIQLNKKWNLISVPFVMLDDSISEVFKDVKDDIEAVWAYDADPACGNEEGCWYLYAPNNGINEIHTMKPGWGYWVKALEPGLLTIGGSLFSPAKSMPDKKVFHGWNLIGYYGTEGAPEGPNGIPGYYGPNLAGDGEEAYCALFSLVDTQEGFPRWSSLVTYWQLDNPDLWKYLDTNEYMNPGAGYWLEIDVKDTYTFSTVCW